MSSASIGSSFASRYLFTPTITSSPPSMRACLRAAHSSIRALAQPDSTAFVIPPIASISARIARALSAISWVSDSIMYEPAHGSTTSQTWVSSCTRIWVLRAMRAVCSVGSATASSSAFVWSDCVPPKTAARASTVVRTTLLYGSCSVSDQPDVWQCVRSIMDFGFFAPKPFMISHQSSRAARSFATSR
jgi:hypothetical protein